MKLIKKETTKTQKVVKGVTIAIALTGIVLDAFALYKFISGKKQSNKSPKCKGNCGCCSDCDCSDDEGDDENDVEDDCNIEDTTNDVYGL